MGHIYTFIMKNRHSILYQLQFIKVDIENEARNSIYQSHFSHNVQKENTFLLLSSMMHIKSN